MSCSFCLRFAKRMLGSERVALSGGPAPLILASRTKGGGEAPSDKPSGSGDGVLLRRPFHFDILASLLSCGRGALSYWEGLKVQMSRVMWVRALLAATHCSLPLTVHPAWTRSSEGAHMWSVFSAVVHSSLRRRRDTGEHAFTSAPYVLTKVCPCFPSYMLVAMRCTVWSHGQWAHEIQLSPLMFCPPCPVLSAVSLPPYIC